MSASRPVFFDPTGRRAKRFSRLGVAAAFTGTIVSIAFVASLIIAHAPHVSGQGGAAAALFSPIRADHISAATSTETPVRLVAELQIKEASVAGVPPSPNEAISTTRDVPKSLAPVPGRSLTIGFYVNWDDASYPALKRTLPRLDWVVPAWLSLQGPDLALTYNVDKPALDLIDTERPTIPVLPMLQNSVDGKWDGPGLARLLADPAERGARLKDIVDFLAANKFQGLTIDFEEVPRAAQKDLQTFLREMSAAFASHGWIIVLAVPVDDDDWDYKTYATLADYLLLMAYDQHWEEGSPGSIAAQDWFRATLDKRMKDLDPHRTIVAIGNYGYDWVKGQTATDLTFQEAVLASRESEAHIDFDADTSNPHFSYVEDDGQTHDVWFLDGVTAFNEIHAADVYKPAGYALWRLGAEDPSVWSVMGRAYGAAAPDALHSIAISQDVDFEGSGEILRVAARPTPGSRTFELDPDTGDIVDQTYTQVPTPYVIQRFGAVPGRLALTFDDGPDPEWTPKIIDILKGKGVPATFFIIGENAEAHPELVRRMVAEGDEVGNHTFTHPNIGEIPAEVAKLELNATQRLFEAITGRSLRLFRPPYFGDAEPTTADEIVPVDIAQSMGYVTVGLHVDPNDWQRPPAETIVERVLSQVSDPNPDVRGNIILLHDAGGDRSQTVAALPKLIDALRDKGYQFVTVSALAGLSRDQAMPPLPSGARARWVDGPVFLTLEWFGYLLGVLFMVAILIGIVRLGFLCALALANRHQDSRRIAPPLPEAPSLVSVLIPAHNESKVIVPSIERILASDYHHFEVLVVDDGSTDATSDLVHTVFGNDPRVRLITEANGGKAAALNQGLAAASGVIVVALDADTQFETDAISKLVRWFADPKVGAVAGNAKVGNRINMVTFWQALEYITAQNLERRALAALGCITVVPGAIGAWRREAIQQVGGFPIDTLAEDQDLTITVQRAGYAVLFDSEAVAWTEAPDTLRGLARQRFRWAYGTLQCLWKHRAIAFRPRFGSLGLVAIPQVWLFQILFALLSPLIDLMFLWQIAHSGIDYLEHGDQFDPTNLMATSLYVATFVLVDAAAAALAFGIERDEKWRLLWWLPLQRFGYRQLMYYVVVKSVIKAVAGLSVSWGLHERKGTVTA
jgi:cellulose synthase/poly-beta-1,6-N-acetylglucosamine synthase-like glycosyltransferase/peptidoglycan/xylan/chitin deacetylase (PgdA/CDA1 family)